MLHITAMFVNGRTSIDATKFHIIWQSGFRGKAVLEIDQSETRIAYGGNSCF
jgi:hypothetical protein